LAEGLTLLITRLVFGGRQILIVPYIFFQVLNFLIESFGLLSDLFPLPSILDAGYPVFDLHLAYVLFNVILPFVLGVFLVIFWLEVSN
jgi:hypothetical protein